MITLKQFLFVCVCSVLSTEAATSDKKPSNQQKRALDYNYPFPIISFQEQPQKFYVETIKSVSPLGQRYLPPTGPTLTAQNGAAKNTPINISFNAFEPEQPSSQAKPTSQAAPAPTVPSSTAAAAPAKKRPGGLGTFKYYGGSGTSSKTDTSSAGSTAAAVSTSKPVVIEPAPVTDRASPKPAAKPATASKTPGYDYPSPKNNRKPSKKEQKLADSKPEESGVGYQYDVPSHPGELHGGFASGAAASAAGSAPAMGLSYMRQSSPYYSFHVMLD